MDKVRLAIVGCGNISQLNVPGYLQHPQCEVDALCDTVPGRAEARARQWGITPKCYTDYAQVLNDPHIDAVELLTPTYLHAEQIVAALAAGKHVSCQKPMCTTVAEADQIIAAAAKAGTMFRITENFLYYPPILKAKALLDSGAIGEPSMFRCHNTRVQDITHPTIEVDPEAYVWRRDPRRNPGGLLYDDGVHKYAVALKWLGDIEQVSALVGHTDDFIMEAPSAVMWKFKDRNCLGLLDYTYAPGMVMRGKYVKVDEFFEIHGSHGIIWVTRCSGEMLDLPPVMLIKGTETVSYQVPMDWRDSFDGAARDFIDSLVQGRQPELDAPTSKKLLQIALAIYQAGRTNRPVRPEAVQ
jgi:predicted dehydrogenase